MKRKVCEKYVTTNNESLKRIYLDFKELNDGKYDVGGKFIYDIDFRNKVIKIEPTYDEDVLKKSTKKGTFSKKKKKVKGEEVLVPVIDINNKNIEEVFKGINKCKVIVYTDEILIVPVREKSNNKADNAVSEIYRISIKDREDILSEVFGELGYGFEFSKDEVTQRLKNSSQFAKDRKAVIRLLSLFSGVGAFEAALEGINANFELVNYSEIKSFISKAYSIIHGVDESLNLGDITNIKEEDLKPVDLITYGFPCTNISSLGNQQGFWDSNRELTASGLFIEAARIIKYLRPKYLLGENVSNLLTEKMKYELEFVLDTLSNLGYNTYYKLLNSKDFSIPHSRKRAFLVSIRDDVDDGKFEFPEPVKLEKVASDFYDKGPIDDMYYLEERHSKYYEEIKLKKLYSSVNADIICCMSTKQGGRSNPQNFVKDDRGYRTLTAGEMFSLQGFKREYGDILLKAGMSMSQIGHMLGNSITVTVLEKIFKNMLPKKYFNKSILGI